MTLFCHEGLFGDFGRLDCSRGAVSLVADIAACPKQAAMFERAIYWNWNSTSVEVLLAKFSSTRRQPPTQLASVCQL
jgi:hypothetical protein